MKQIEIKIDNMYDEINYLAIEIHKKSCNIRNLNRFIEKWNYRETKTKLKEFLNKEINTINDLLQIIKNEKKEANLIIEKHNNLLNKVRKLEKLIEIKH